MKIVEQGLGQRFTTSSANEFMAVTITRHPIVDARDEIGLCRMPNNATSPVK